MTWRAVFVRFYLKALPDNTVEGFKNYIVKFQTLSADEQFNLFIDEVAVLEVGVTDADAANITITRGRAWQILPDTSSKAF